MNKSQLHASTCLNHINTVSSKRIQAEKQFILYDAIYIKFKNRLNSSMVLG